MSFYSLCPVLHSKTGGSKDQFLYENIVASYGLQQIGLKIEVTNHQNFEIFNFSDWAPALSIACHDAFFCLKHTHIISCKKKKTKNRLGINIVESDEWKKRNVLDLFLFIFQERINWPLLFNFFCMRCCLMSTWWEIFYEVLLKFLPKMLPGETLCKSAQIFPPKVLVYIAKLFRNILFINLTDY